MYPQLETILYWCRDVFAYDVAEPGAEHAGQGTALPEALAHVVSRSAPHGRRRAG